MPQAVEALGGRLDILVNNAGVTRDNLAMRMKDEEWSDVIRINLEAGVPAGAGGAEADDAGRDRRIISITSIVGVTGNPGQANYAASKAGLIGMSKALAQEVASRNITVNCIAPGFIASAMTDALPEVQKEALLGRIRPGNWARAATSPRRRFIWRARRRRTSPAKLCTSTAAWRCCNRRQRPHLTATLASGAGQGLGRVQRITEERHNMSETAERVKKIVVEHLGVESDKVTEEASFIDDLGADSLDIVEL